MVFTEAFIGSESSLFVAIQYIVIVSWSILLIITVSLHSKGNKLWGVPASLLLILSLFLTLGTTCTYEIWLDNNEFIVDNPIEVSVVVRNPWPLPVWYAGYDTSRITGALVNTSSENSMIAWVASKTSMSRQILPPFGVHVIRTQRLTPNDPGFYEITAQIEAYRTDIVTVKTVLVEVDPLFIEEIVWNRNGKNLPYLSFVLTNLADVSITNLNVEIDGMTLPWSFGVTRNTPIEPSGIGGGTVFTVWQDLDEDDLVGKYPLKGFRYPVRIKVMYDDNRTRLRKYEIIGEDLGGINSIIGSNDLHFQDTSLFTTKEGGRISLSLRNNWQRDKNQMITGLDIYVDSKKVVDSGQWYSFGEYWVASNTFWMLVVEGQLYNVTLLARSFEGEVSKTTKFVTCEPFILESPYPWMYPLELY